MEARLEALPLSKIARWSFAIKNIKGSKTAFVNGETT